MYTRKEKSELKYHSIDTANKFCLRSSIGFVVL